MSDTASNGIGDRLPILPQGWAQATISDLIGKSGVFIDGDWVETKDQDPQGDIRLIQLADIGDGIFRDKSNRFLTSAKAAELNCTFLKENDVLIARMPDPLGRACIFPYINQQCVTVVDVCIVRTGISGIDHHWLMYTINSPKFRLKIDALQSGSTRKRISRGNLSKLELSIPPRPEQHRIVTKIEELFTQLDAGVVSLKKVQVQLKRYRQTVLKAAFDGRLTQEWREEHLDIKFKSFTNSPIRSNNSGEKSRKGRLWGSGSVPELPERFKKSIPSAWKWDKLKNLGNGIDETVQVGPMSMQTKDLTDSGVPVLTIGSVQWGFFNEDKMSYMPIDIAKKFKRYSLQKDDIIFTRSGTIGRSAVVTQKQTGYIISFNLLRVRTDPKNCIPRYLFYVFCGAPHIKWETEQASIGTTRSCVSTKILEDLDIPLSSIPEQEKIIEIIDHHFSIINHLENTIETILRQAETLRQTILKSAFEGKLVPQDPTDEPASILLKRIKTEKAKTITRMNK